MARNSVSSTSNAIDTSYRATQWTSEPTSTLPYPLNPTHPNLVLPQNPCHNALGLSVPAVAHAQIITASSTYPVPSPISPALSLAQFPTNNYPNSQDGFSPGLSQQYIPPSNVPTPPSNTPTPVLHVHTLRRRNTRSASSVGTNLRTQNGTWTKEDQAEFECMLVRLTASANFPLSWVENPVWLQFCDRFLPGSKSPSRKVLTSRILPKEVGRFRAAAQEAANGCYATLQCDGWTAINFIHLVAFMITTSLRKVCRVSLILGNQFSPLCS